MLVEIFERIPTKKGQLTPGQLVELPQEVITKLAGRVRPSTFDQVHGQLDRMGDWTDVADLAAKKCPDLLEAARQAGRDVDRDPALLGEYYRAWRVVFLTARGQHAPA